MMLVDYMLVGFTLNFRFYLSQEEDTLLLVAELKHNGSVTKILRDGSTGTERKADSRRRSRDSVGCSASRRSSKAALAAIIPMTEDF
jgi:hypothetical protein